MFTDAVLSVYAGLLIFAALSDVRRLRIPNNVPLALLLLYPLYLLSIGSAAVAPLSLALALGVFAIGFFFFARGWMGGGDVKLLSVGALWAGPDLAFDFFFVTSFVGGLQAVLYVLPASRWLPYWASSALAMVPSIGPAGVIGTSTAAPGAAAGAQPLRRQRRLPYGLSIAAGGLVVGARLAGLISA